MTDDICITGAKIPSFHSFMSRSVESSMYLSECTDDEILLIIKDLDNGKASDIPIKLVKQSASVIAPILRQHYNICMSKGEFPDFLKIGKITPVFKKGDQEKFENYRPVSTLPIFGKIFEKVIYSRLYEYLSKKGILTDNQFGFRKLHSCSHALNYSASQIQKHLDDNKHVLGIYIDLSKAFDTIDHIKLLDKLERYGIRGNVHKLMDSYLSNRMQYIDVLGESSSKLPVKYGVPQGSVLGPLLFLIYINDISNCTTSGTFVLFADDTNVFVAGESIDDVYIKANHILDCIYKYMAANQLHINMSKSCYMHFQPKLNRDDLGLELLFSQNSLEITGVPIKAVKTTKFLGITIDDELSWEPHIKKLSQKLRCQVGALRRIKDNVPLEYHKDLYYTLFESHLSYCISVWGGVHPSKLEPLFIAQKSCIRLFFGNKNLSDKYSTCVRCRPFGKQKLGQWCYKKESTKPLFKKNDILAVHNIYTYHCFIELFKILKFRQPYSLFKLFDLPLSSTRSTRYNDTHIKVLVRSFCSLFTYKAPKIWNGFRIKLEIFDFSPSDCVIRTHFKNLILSIQHSGSSMEWNTLNLRTSS